VSRHTLALAKAPNGFAIVGYDRPVGAFFCQVWPSEKADHPVVEDSCFDIDHLDSLGAVAKLL